MGTPFPFLSEFVLGLQLTEVKLYFIVDLAAYVSIQIKLPVLMGKTCQLFLKDDMTMLMNLTDFVSYWLTNGGFVLVLTVDCGQENLFIMDCGLEPYCLGQTDTYYDFS